jgi:hypothetical protein
MNMIFHVHIHIREYEYESNMAENLMFIREYEYSCIPESQSPHFISRVLRLRSNPAVPSRCVSWIQQPSAPLLYAKQFDFCLTQLFGIVVRLFCIAVPLNEILAL